MNPMVYLAGPITGCSYEGCTDWRCEAQNAMEDYPVTMLSPMRGKKYLANEKCIGNAYLCPLSCPRGIMTRDHWDATRCDILLVNFLGAKTVSIGTTMEIAWAWDHDIPIICIMEETGNIHDHAMIQEAVGFRVETLEQALAIIKSMLNLEL